MKPSDAHRISILATLFLAATALSAGALADDADSTPPTEPAPSAEPARIRIRSSPSNTKSPPARLRPMPADSARSRCGSRSRSRPAIAAKLITTAGPMVVGSQEKVKLVSNDPMRCMPQAWETS